MLRLLTRCMQVDRNLSANQRRRYLRFASTATAGGDIEMKRLDGKVAVITGGASGLGKTTAGLFINHGAHVLIADIDDVLGPQAALDLGPRAHFIHCDVVSESDVAAAVTAAVDIYGKLDIMFNNAGIAGPAVPSGVADLDLSDFDRVMDVNVRGTISGIKHATRFMNRAGSGSILCTCSVSGVMAGLGPHPYTVSKHAVAGMVKSVAAELCRYGVRVNCISPAPVATPMVINQLAGFYSGANEDAIKEMVGRLGELKGARCEEIDVAKAALYLASDEAKYVTGHNLVVDGGFTCFKNLPFPAPSSI